MRARRGAANETAQQWQDSGSGPGHMQTVTAPELTPVALAHRAILDHTTGCGDERACDECRAGGMDCETAASLRQAWRDAKAASK